MADYHGELLWRWHAIFRDISTLNTRESVFARVDEEEGSTWTLTAFNDRALGGREKKTRHLIHDRINRFGQSETKSQSEENAGQLR